MSNQRFHRKFSTSFITQPVRKFGLKSYTEALFDTLQLVDWYASFEIWYAVLHLVAYLTRVKVKANLDIFCSKERTRVVQRSFFSRKSITLCELIYSFIEAVTGLAFAFKKDMWGDFFLIDLFKILCLPYLKVLNPRIRYFEK